MPDSPISICICTYNRAVSLDQTLASISTLSDLLITGDEVIVIDNSSTDNTPDVVISYKAELPIKYFFEPVQGLSAARNRALEEFCTDVCVFVDDDITLTAGLINAYRTAIEGNSAHHFFGGRLTPDWQGQEPAWYRGESIPLLDGILGRYDLGAQNIAYHQHSLLPYGANFALRRSLIDRVGSFDLSLGVQGDKLGRGEETDYFNRAMALGFSGMYLANAGAGHRLQRERLATTQLFSYGVQKGKVLAIMNNARPQHAYRTMLAYLLRGVWQLAKGRVDRYFQCVINIGIQYGIMQYAAN